MIQRILFFYLFKLIISCSFNSDNGFKIIDNEYSGIEFSNNLIENNSLNILDNEFFYNGAGVALADLNNDSLLDIFFTGNQVDNELYLNLGDFKFKNVSLKSKINKVNPLIWSSGVNVIDINNDNLMDIYICNTLRIDPGLRENLLFINKGINSEGIPVFIEMSKEYGLNDDTYSSHAQFFDYDNDGDLDVFIGVNRIEGIDPNVFRNIHDDDKNLSKDRIYENISVDSLDHPFFIDVTKKSQIRFHGYSHSTIINDFNNDGWLDIYVANDYLSSDLVYINNKDKTFTNKADEIFKHYSLSAMGSDISDINNDGRLDLFTSEMQPYYNKRKKLFQKGTNYQREILTRKYNYEYQYTRNTLQLNMGINPNNNLPFFSEIGMFSKVHETDWSWSSLFADFDNDGWKDLLVVNGFPKDVIDKDFGNFRQSASRLVSKEVLLSAIPQIKVPNFIFKNMGNLQFEDVSKKWSIDFPSYSNGAAYGDLDNDGDLDIVFNNINDKASLLRNDLKSLESNNYIRIKLVDSLKKKNLYGSKLTIYYNNKKQAHSLISGRGYLSKTEDVIHFGLGKNSEVDSVLVNWVGGKNQIFMDLKINSLNILEFKENLEGIKLYNNLSPMFYDSSRESRILYKNKDIDFIDFNIQRTIPHKFSQYGPVLSVGDINGDGLEDLLIGSSRSYEEQLFIQKPDGTFKSEKINLKENNKLHEEDSGIALFDADNDNDLDIYISHGSSQYSKSSKLYEDVLWINDGSGKFDIKKDALPKNNSNGSAVKICDFDKDGDLDLFVASRVSPQNYPKSDKSFLLENITDNDMVKFIDSTEKIFGDIDFGMVSDFVWSDFNNDNWIDLIIASDWSELRFFKNNKGQLEEIKKTGIENFSGWWNSINVTDLDNDGDSDYIVGNFGENSYLRASASEPITLTAKDFDSNGSIDPFISYYLRDSIGIRKNFIYHPMEDVIKQFTGIRKKYNSFGSFGEETMDEIFDSNTLKDAIIKKSTWMKSSWVENLGNNKFRMHSLPIQAQWAPVYSIISHDFDDDSFQDLMVVGNDYGVETKQGRADALNGLIFKNKKGKGFSFVDIDKTNLFIDKDAKSLVKLSVKDEYLLYISSQNNDSLKVYREKNNKKNKVFNWEINEQTLRVYYDSENYRFVERNSQNSFQSQSSEKIFVSNKTEKIDFYNSSGDLTRSVKIK